LTKHHNYANKSDLNLNPIGNNELARLAKVSTSTASTFFNNEFNRGEKGGHEQYKSICLRAQRAGPRYLIAALKTLNNEFRPGDFLDARTPDESQKDKRRKPRASDQNRDLYDD
jgi:hypothetical protein